MNLPTEFRESLRYENYALGPESLVIDCGGYHGEWAKGILDMYGPVKLLCVFEPIREFFEICKSTLEFYPCATVINAAVGASYRREQFGIQGGLSGKFNGGANGQEVVDIIDFPEWFLNHMRVADLVKLNCEGSEFEIIPALIASEAILRIKNLQVQFHRLHDSDDEKYQEIREQLSKTHELTYDFDWVWSSWRRK